MSRNLCRSDCRRCQGAVVCVESWRPITEDDCGTYMLKEYSGMLVAYAECRWCRAKYLAWYSHPGRARWNIDDSTSPDDLSYRSTFNDEPDPEDEPPMGWWRPWALRWGLRLLGRTP